MYFLVLLLLYSFDFFYCFKFLEGCILDIDECVMGNGGCETLCFNKFGLFFCGCELGYFLMFD